MSSKKLEARVQALQKRPENKRCFSCGRTGLQQAVVFPFGIFVCATCSGIHRNFPGQQVATINMVNFTEKQVAILEQNGNARATAYWLANTQSYPLPNQPTHNQIQDFIQKCFVQKYWALKEGQQQPQQQQQQQPAVSTTLQRPTGVNTNVNTLQRATGMQQSQQQPQQLQQPIQVQHQQPQQQIQVQHQPAPDFLDGANFSGAREANNFDAFDNNDQVQHNDHLPAHLHNVLIPQHYGEIVFDAAVQPSSLTGSHLDAMKALSKVMAQSILQNQLSANEFFEIVSTAAQITAVSWAQREASQQGQQAMLSVDIASLPLSGERHAMQPVQVLPFAPVQPKAVLHPPSALLSQPQPQQHQPQQQQQQQQQAQTPQVVHQIPLSTPTSQASPVFSAMASPSNANGSVFDFGAMQSAIPAATPVAAPAPVSVSHQHQPVAAAQQDDFFSANFSSPSSFQPQPQQQQQQQQPLAVSTPVSQPLSPVAASNAAFDAAWASSQQPPQQQQQPPQPASLGVDPTLPAADEEDDIFGNLVTPTAAATLDNLGKPQQQQFQQQQQQQQYGMMPQQQQQPQAYGQYGGQNMMMQPQQQYGGQNMMMQQQPQQQQQYGQNMMMQPQQQYGGQNMMMQQPQQQQYGQNMMMQPQQQQYGGQNMMMQQPQQQQYGGQNMMMQPQQQQHQQGFDQQQQQQQVQFDDIDLPF